MAVIHTDVTVYDVARLVPPLIALLGSSPSSSTLQNNSSAERDADAARTALSELLARPPAAWSSAVLLEPLLADELGGDRLRITPVHGGLKERLRTNAKLLIALAEAGVEWVAGSLVDFSVVSSGSGSGYTLGSSGYREGGMAQGAGVGGGVTRATLAQTLLRIVLALRVDAGGARLEAQGGAQEDDDDEEGKGRTKAAQAPACRCTFGFCCRRRCQRLLQRRVRCTRRSRPRCEMLQYMIRTHGRAIMHAPRGAVRVRGRSVAPNLLELLVVLVRDERTVTEAEGEMRKGTRLGVARAGRAEGEGAQGSIFFSGTKGIVDETNKMRSVVYFSSDFLFEVTGKVLPLSMTPNNMMVGNSKISGMDGSPRRSLHVLAPSEIFTTQKKEVRHDKILTNSPPGHSRPNSPVAKWIPTNCSRTWKIKSICI
ncbi:hypothetical protein B0H19DRAFT_1346019 [Mycena capillaripes]|nr:hypothetical protein B0H19DRAFT_1346019 [Mycena capillaripes]